MPKAERKARIPSADGGVPQARNHLAFMRGGAARKRGMSVYYESPGRRYVRFIREFTAILQCAKTGEAV